MNTASARTGSALPVTGHIASDLLGFFEDGRPNYRKVAETANLNKSDLSKLARVSRASVRFDEAIPEAVAARLREIANIANLVAEFFDGDQQKVRLWFELPNPMLGNISPQTMIRGDRYKRLLNFVLEAREAELAAAEARKRA